MRFLGIGDAADLASLYLRLAEDGHEVKVFIGNPLCRDTLAGLVPQVEDWQAELHMGPRRRPRWMHSVRECRRRPGRASRSSAERDGFNVIGSSAYGARLENDRAYAQRILGELGLSTAPFSNSRKAEAARRFIAQRPARYVLKSNGPNAATFVGRQREGADVAARFSQPTIDTGLRSSDLDGVHRRH